MALQATAGVLFVYLAVLGAPVDSCNGNQLKAVALQSSSSCGPPAPESDESSKVWNRTKASEVMRETLVLLEFMVAKQMGKQAEFLRSPTPFVTAPRPTWMLEPDGVVREDLFGDGTLTPMLQVRTWR